LGKYIYDSNMKKIILGVITCLLSLSVFGQVNEFKFGFPLRANGGLNVGTDKVQLDSIVRDGTTIKFYTGVTELLPNMAGGSVTSVGMTVPTGLSISGSPITGSGTLALTFAPGYSIPSDASQSNWNTAYDWGDHVLGGYQSQSDILDAFAALTNSSGVLTNDGSGGLTWTSVGGSGTVTSVALSVPTGLSVTGSPITSSGTLAISLASGYSIPSTSVQSNWTTAYNERAQWDGGSTNLVASTGRTSLGGTTIGQNMFTMTNPDAIRFPRTAANNTWVFETAATFKTALSLTASDVGLSTIAFDVSTLQTRTDSIVDALKDTILLSTALNINLATDTVATKAEVRAVSGGGTVGITLNSGTFTLNGSEGTADDITFYTNGDGSYDLPAGGGNLTIQSQVQGWINDSLDKAKEDIRKFDSDTIPLFVFGLGSGHSTDTALFNNGRLAGAFYNSGSDTLYVTELRGVLVEGTGMETIDVQVSWHTNMRDVSAINLNTTALTINNMTTGTSDTSFNNNGIPPGRWVWCVLSGASSGNKPTALMLTMTGYRRNRSY
jgi:hypothetical protein